MGKRLLFICVAILAVWQNASASYDFSAVAPTGQTLYFSYANGSTGNSVYVTYPGNGYFYEGFTMPTGALTIPSSVSNGSRTYSVRGIDIGAFYGCTGLTSVTIPNSVTSIGGIVFYDCTGLTSVTIPNSVTSIGNYAFRGCIGLTSITIPNSVISIGKGAISYCTGLTSVVVSAGNSHYDSRDNCNAIIETATNTLIAGCKNTVIPTTVTNIGQEAFYGINNLTSISIPNSVTCIGESAFDDCTGLTSVTISNSVTSIGELAFSLCTSLTSITIPNSVASISSYAFSGCTGLTSITSLATTAPILDDGVFYGVPSDIDVNIPCGSLASYEDRWSSFFNNFIEPPTVIIDASSADESMGYVYVSTQPICQLSTVVIQATANYGYHFAQWDDGNTDNPRAITMTQDTLFVAIFAKNQYTVTGTTNDSVKGVVSGNATVDYLDRVTLTATANYGYHFAYWNDYNTYNPRTVVATGNINLIAIFGFNQYAINLSADTSIHGYVYGAGMYNYLSERTIRASANYGYYFVQWNDGNTDNPRTITLTQDTQFVAQFAKNTYTLEFHSADSSIGVVDTTSISGEYLDSVLIHATAIPHYHFVRWNDNNTDNPRRFVFDGNHAYTAYFAIDTHTVSVQIDNLAHGMVGGSGIREYGQPITVWAEPYSDYQFTHWSNGSTHNPYTFAVLQDSALTAFFVAYGEPWQDTVLVHDTIAVNDTVTVYDTITFNDTVIITIYDTITVYDTIIIYDTVTVGIDGIEAISAKIYQRNGQVVVEGAEGNTVTLYDVNGRVLATKQDYDMPLSFDVPSTGTYMIKIGSAPARRVVVIR